MERRTRKKESRGICVTRKVRFGGLFDESMDFHGTGNSVCIISDRIIMFLGGL
jgi:hypothetical protein